MFTKRTVVGGLFFVLSGLWLTSCRQTDGPVVAQVGNTKITLDELKYRLQETPANYQQYIASPEGRRQFLDLMIREKVLLTEAKALGISRDPSYKKAVAKFKADSQRRLQEYQETLLVESTLQQLRAKDLAATDTDVEKYYNDHHAEYDKPTEILVSHILLSTESDAQTALARIKSGEPFEQVAKEMSKDPATAVHGGRLTPFSRGSLPPEFEDAAFQLKTGEISGPVKTQFGFHIIKKLGEKMLPAKSFADVKEEIRQKLERDKFNQWIAAKQALVGVKVDDQAMSRLSLEEPSKP